MLLLLVPIFMNSCSDDIPPVVEDKTFYLEDFPMDDGYYWQYLKINNNTDERDTIECYAFAYDTIINDQHETSIRLDYSQNGTHLFSEFVQIDSNELIVYHDVGYVWAKEKIHLYFPIEAAKQNNTFNFESINYIDTKYDTEYLYVYHLHEIYDTINVMKNVGMVHRTFEHINDASWGWRHYETWILMDYDFKP
ncbi:MAG: hypothetical protein AB8G11_17120 [Saprospiraceae bacterium]